MRSMHVWGIRLCFVCARARLPESANIYLANLAKKSHIQMLVYVCNLLKIKHSFDDPRNAKPTHTQTHQASVGQKKKEQHFCVSMGDKGEILHLIP